MPKAISLCYVNLCLQKTGMPLAGLVYFYLRLDENLCLKISDYGLSRHLYDKYEYKQDPQNQRPAPIKWMSPEAQKSRKFTVKSDVVSN